MGGILIHLMPAILISFIVQVLLHEIGHLIGGIITGWRFLFLQIYRLVLKKEDNKMRLTIVSDVGFQCIMCPEMLNAKAFLYTMGGCIINLFTGVAGLIILIVIPISPLVWLYMWCFSVFGIGMYIMNGTASIKRVCNDKACYKLLKTDKHTTLCHNAQLLVAKHLMKGLTYRQIGQESICLCHETAENDIEAYQMVLEYYYYLDTENYNAMKKALNKIQKTDNISSNVIGIISMEQIYMQLFSGFLMLSSREKRRRVDNINIDLTKLYNTPRLEMKKDIHSLRVKTALAAYEKCRQGRARDAVYLLENAINGINKKRYAYEGDRIFFINQLQKIKEILVNNLS